jgi:hypothetical protein
MIQLTLVSEVMVIKAKRITVNTPGCYDIEQNYNCISVSLYESSVPQNWVQTNRKAINSTDFSDDVLQGNSDSKKTQSDISYSLLAAQRDILLYKGEAYISVSRGLTSDIWSWTICILTDIWKYYSNFGYLLLKMETHFQEVLNIFVCNSYKDHDNNRNTRIYSCISSVI